MMLQTYFTEMSFGRTAQDLDDGRLLQQRHEALELLDLLRSGRPGSEPAAYMWMGYEPALLVYGLLICLEAHQKRRYEDRVFWDLMSRKDKLTVPFYMSKPPWFEDRDVIRSHRSVLIREDSSYKELFPHNPLNMPYLWPVVKDDGTYELKVSKADLELLKQGKRKLPKDIAERVSNL